MRLHRVPKSIVLDHDTKFMSTFWHELHRLMGTKLLMSTAFHPQMDGATEQANCSIGQILRMIINDDQKNWADKCSMVEFVLNSCVSATTGFTLFELNQGYMPRSGCRRCLTPHCDLYHVGDHVYLSTQNLTLPEGRARKLVPSTLGPIK